MKFLIHFVFKRIDLHDTYHVCNVISLLILLITSWQVIISGKYEVSSNIDISSSYFYILIVYMLFCILSIFVESTVLLPNIKYLLLYFRSIFQAYMVCKFIAWKIWGVNSYFIVSNYIFELTPVLTSKSQVKKFLLEVWNKENVHFDVGTAVDLYLVTTEFSSLNSYSILTLLLSFNIFLKELFLMSHLGTCQEAINYSTNFLKESNSPYVIPLIGELDFFKKALLSYPAVMTLICTLENPNTILVWPFIWMKFGSDLGFYIINNPVDSVFFGIIPTWLLLKISHEIYKLYLQPDLVVMPGDLFNNQPIIEGLNDWRDLVADTLFNGKNREFFPVSTNSSSVWGEIYESKQECLTYIFYQGNILDKLESTIIIAQTADLSLIELNTLHVQLILCVVATITWENSFFLNLVEIQSGLEFLLSLEKSLSCLTPYLTPVQKLSITSKLGILSDFLDSYLNR